MPSPVYRARLAAMSVALLLTAGISTPLAAQDATPAAGGMPFPITPDPGGCQVEPRSADELLALWYTPEGSPVPAATPTWGAQTTSLTLPVGPLADETTAAGVTRTVSEIFHCLAAGDFRRATALFTENWIRSSRLEPDTTMEDARAFLEATPIADPAGQPGETTIVAVTDAMNLGDGRVGAFVVTRSDEQFATVYLILEREGDRLLADELIEFVRGDEGEGA